MIEHTVLMEGVRIIFRNFRGEKSKFNQEGVRNFSVLLDDKTASAMSEDGWNVKVLEPREDADEGELPQPFLPVFLRWDIRPPRVVMITSRGRTNIDEDKVELFDWADIQNVDLIVRPFNWEVNGKTGVKAYVQSLYITINEDELQLKYADLDEQ